MILNADIVHQILGGKRSMIRLPAEGRKPSVGHVYAVRTPEDRKTRCHITVTSIVEREITEGKHGSSWEIRFQKGDHSDKPRLLAARPGPPNGDYVTDALRALNGSAEEVSEATHGRYAALADERCPDILAEQKRRLEAAIREIRKHPASPLTNKRLREAEERIARIRPRGMEYRRVS